MFFERSHKENTADNALRCRVLVGGYLALSGRIDAEVVHSPFSLTESEAPVTAQPCSRHSVAAVARRRRCCILLRNTLEFLDAWLEAVGRVVLWFKNQDQPLA